MRCCLLLPLTSGACAAAVEHVWVPPRIRTAAAGCAGQVGSPAVDQPQRLLWDHNTAPYT